MRILITGANSNVGRGIIPRLAAHGHQLVLSDLNRVPEAEPFSGHEFVPCDVQIGFGLEKAAAGCDLILHLPAWHGIHWRDKSEADFWRLNVDGVFWMFQAAQSAGICSVVFLSSQAWHGHYDKYGFTKRVGEELCEYNRRNHGVRYVAIRPHDFTPWWNFTNGYGARLLYGGVDREDVLDCIESSVATLLHPLATGAESEGLIVNAVRANTFTAEDVMDWEADPLAACERLFPGSRVFVDRYALNIHRKPSVVEIGEGAAAVGYTPKRHFGTFLEDLAQKEAEVGESAIRALECPYR